MAKDYLYPGSILSLPREALKRLMKEDSGDAALLYLALVAEESDKLSWDSMRREKAYAHLVKQALVDEKSTAKEKKELSEAAVPVPEYGETDVRMALEREQSFAMLVEDMQRVMSRILSPADLKILMVIYDYLAMPSELILTLVSWCMENQEKKYGKGRRLAMTTLRKEAFLWHKQGIVTLDKGEEYLLARRAREQGANRMLPLLGIQGRAAVDGELRYLEAWATMGFEDEAIRYAYEITVMNTRSLSWAYMNSILKSWHGKNLHTKAEILEKEQKGKPQWQAGLKKKEPTAIDTERQKQDMNRLDRLLADMEKKEGES